LNVSVFEIREGDVPVIVTAIHAGHDVSPEVAALLAIDETDRLREEDPFTDLFAPAKATLVKVGVSRFEVDMNRPRKSAVYLEPSDAWGLDIWRSRPGPDIMRLSLERYDRFHVALRALTASTIERHGAVLVLDVHSYNHRRGGADAPAADPACNPEVNLGTGAVRGRRCREVADTFIAAMEVQGFEVGENVKFAGGHLSHWVAESFPRHTCVLAIEFKKTFMDEWTGVPDPHAIERIRGALTRVMPPMIIAMKVARR